MATWDAVRQKFDGNRSGDRSRPHAKEPSPLAGLIFDTDGNPFTPSHTVKAGQRYRYYVDRALIRGEKPDGDRKRRIPAPEIEAIVRQELAELLDDPERVLETLCETPDAAEAEQIIREARKLHPLLADTKPGGWSECIRPILHRVVIGIDVVHLRIRRDGLRALLSLPPSSEDGSGESASLAIEDQFDLVVQARIRTRGNQIKLIVGKQGAPQGHKKDAALLKAVTRAHLWFDRLRRGDAVSVRQIAREERVTGSYVSRVLRLAFLAPDIIDAILDGRHPVDLTAERLLVHEDLPIDWQEQRRQLGFDHG